jgi:O-methyltransferase involved in polyketide biosynthesis
MKRQSSALEDIQSTARWMAAVRALDRIRAEPLIDDPFAAALAGPDGTQWIPTCPLQRVTSSAMTASTYWAGGAYPWSRT